MRTFPIHENGEDLGTIYQRDRGFEAFDPRGAYLATFPSLYTARKALRDLRAAGQDAAFQKA